MKQVNKKKYVSRLVAGASWCAVIVLWLSAASVFVNPLYFRFAAVAGLMFPFCLFGVVLMLLVSLAVKPRHAWIALFGLAGAFFSIRDYCPFNFAKAPPADAMKVLSFNTESWGCNRKGPDGKNAVAAYIARQRPDIACIQEANYGSPILDNDILPVLRPILPNWDTININANIIAVFTHYRIIKKEVISHGTANGSGAFTLVRRPGDTVVVVNCHLESMHLSNNERQQYHTMVRDPGESNVEGSSRMLVSKISNAARLRSVQATKTALYVRRHIKKPLILCGDFNDTPISFTHHRIVSTGLTDAYVSTGRGIGRSFNRDAIVVRIDNLMCSPHWRPYGAYVDQSFAGSDHYPIIGWFALKDAGRGK